MKLILGDCLEKLKNIPSDSVDLVLTDPPYDIKNTTAGGDSQLAKSIQGMNTEIKNADIVSGYDIRILDELVRVNKRINMYIFCNKAQLPMYMKYFVTDRKCSFDLIKWVKTNAMPTYHNKYLSDTEYCFYARKRGFCNPNNYQDASTLYNESMNVSDKKKYNYPTIKPLPLIEKLLRNSSKPGDTIIDPFMGTGTTGVAAKLMNRHFIGIENDPEYFETCEYRIVNTIQPVNLNSIFSRG